MKEEKKNLIGNTPECGKGSLIELFEGVCEPAFDDADAQSKIWGGHWGANSEYGKLKVVYMHRPDTELLTMRSEDYRPEYDALIGPGLSYYWAGSQVPDLKKVQEQHDYFADVLRSYGVEIVYSADNPDTLRKTVNTRDVAAAVPGGMMVLRPAPVMRHGEEVVATRTFGKRGVPILTTIHGTGMLEGGGFMMLDSEHAVVTESCRCNREAINQVKALLEPMGIEVIVVEVPGYEIHIDGMLSIIDKKTALVNSTLLPYTFICKLQSLGYKLIEIPKGESWAINNIAVEPGVICMIEGLDRSKKLLEENGIKVIPIPWDENIKSGGGPHCGTCPLMREYV